MTVPNMLLDQVIRRANVAGEPARIQVIYDCFNRLPTIFLQSYLDKSERAKLAKKHKAEKDAWG